MMCDCLKEKVFLKNQHLTMLLKLHQETQKSLQYKYILKTEFNSTIDHTRRAVIRMNENIQILDNALVILSQMEGKMDGLNSFHVNDTETSSGDLSNEF